MWLSEHIKQMQELLEREGDMKVTQIATLHPVEDLAKNPLANVFESTVCSHRVLNTPFGRKREPMKRVLLMWQT